MAKVRLNKAETVPVTINNVAKTVVRNGKAIVTYSNYIRLAPGKVYETDDEAMLGFFRNYTTLIRYNAQTEEALKNNGVPYSIEYCKVCSGRVKKIKYHVVEVIDNE